MRCLNLKLRVWCGLLAAVSLLSFPCVLRSQETMTSPPRPFTWRLSPANLTLPGISAIDFKTNVRIGGEQWSYFANVKITEALPGKPATWTVRKGYVYGDWGYYHPGLITYSTWWHTLQDIAAMTPIQRQQYVRALFFHEAAHGMGCPWWCNTPDQMKAYLRAKYGPPAVRGVVPEEIQPLPPRPKPGRLCSVVPMHMGVNRADRATLDAGARVTDRPGLPRWRERGPGTWGRPWGNW